MKSGNPPTVEEMTPAKADPSRLGTIVIPSTGGRGAGKVVKAAFPLGDELSVEKDSSFRQPLADWITADDNPFFARAAANRFWSLLFGKGLCTPVDDLDETNPPTHPEVLQVLADEFRASNFDIRHLLRCITATQAYQRSSKPLSANAADEVLYSRQSVKVMSAEMLYDSLCQALGVDQLKVTVPVSGTTSGRRARGRADARSVFIEFFNTRDSDTPATEYTHGILQALSLLNDPSFSEQAPVLDQLMKTDDTPETVIEGLFLATLSRPPTAGELERLTAYAKARKDQRQAYAGILWILLNTPEFVLVR